MDKISILKVNINNINYKEVETLIKEAIEKNHKKTIFTPNTEIIMMCQKDKGLREIINSGDIVTPDGIGLIYAAKIKNLPLKERVTGFDISMKLLELSKNNKYNVFLLGGKEGIAEKAKNRLENKGFKNIVGHQHGYFFNDKNYKIIEKTIINRINDLKTDILFVGFGSPKQEKWINENIDKLNCNIIIGNGGTIDVLSGEVKRAPKIYQKLGLEWLYRLFKEPKRIKRQISIPSFLIKIILNKNSVEKLKKDG